MKPEITTSEADLMVSKTIAPKVTVESITEKIGEIDYVIRGVLVVCIITMKSGFTVIGKSAPASPENFSEEVGRRYAYDDAFRQLWPLEGYLLKERLNGGA